jgi:hypothetical protein
MFNPLQAKEVDFFIAHPFIEKLSDAPPVSTNIVFSNTVTDDEIELPYTDGALLLSAFSEDGASIFLAQRTDTEVLLRGGVVFQYRTYWRYLKYIRVVGSAHLLVERAEIYDL